MRSMHNPTKQILKKIIKYNSQNNLIFKDEIKKIKIK
jgi:hypothetical protein